MSVGGFLVTAAGKRFYFDRPEEFDYQVEDISIALSNLCRFVGQLGWWSVAQHSLFVASLVRPSYRLQGLLHDASEAFIADIPGPFKRTPAMEGYRLVERRVENAIFKKFGVTEDATASREVKIADLVALRAEAERLGVLSREWSVWGLPQATIPKALLNMTPSETALELSAAILEASGASPQKTRVLPPSLSAQDRAVHELHEARLWAKNLAFWLDYNGVKVPLKTCRPLDEFLSRGVP